MTIIQAQDAYIARVNGTLRTKDRGNRIRRAAGKVLRAYLASIGITEHEQQRNICIDAWEMAELQRICEE